MKALFITACGASQLKEIGDRTPNSYQLPLMRKFNSFIGFLENKPPQTTDVVHLRTFRLQSMNSIEGVQIAVYVEQIPPL